MGTTSNTFQCYKRENVSPRLILLTLLLLLFFGQKGRASFQLFKKRRASPKLGRAPRPAKTPRQNTDTISREIVTAPLRSAGCQKSSEWWSRYIGYSLDAESNVCKNGTL